MGISHVAYEASSHGLDQHRAEGVPLAAAAFTNFSRDHLDYHETMDAYFEAKMRLFERLLPPGKPAVIWTDDPKSDEVVDRARGRGHEVLTVGRKGETIRLVEQSTTALGQTLMLEHGSEALSHRAAADRRLPGGQRAHRCRARARDRRRVGCDLFSHAARRAGARAAGARGDQPRRASRSISIMPIRPTRSRRRSRRCARTSKGD